MAAKYFPFWADFRLSSRPAILPAVSVFMPRRKNYFLLRMQSKNAKVYCMPLKTATTDISQAIASIEKMTQLDVETICFGHGRPITEDAKGRLMRLLEKVRN